MTEEVNGVTLQLPEVGHVGFPTAMSGDASDPEFYLRKSVVRPSAPVRPSARPPAPVRPLSTPVRSSARRAHPRPLVRPPVRSLATVRPSAPRPPHPRHPKITYRSLLVLSFLPLLRHVRSPRLQFVAPAGATVASR